MNRVRADIAMAGVLAVVFAWAASTALGFPEQARTFPLTVALVSLVLALVQVWLSLRGIRAARTAPAPPPGVAEPEEAEELSQRERLRRGGVFVAWVTGTLLGVWLIGFVATTALVALGYSRITGRERWPAAIGVALVSWALIFGVFDRLLHVPLPAGVLAELLGLG